MAFISEINFLGRDESANEFIEIALETGDDPANFTISLYNGVTGQLAGATTTPGAGTTIASSILGDGEATLDELTLGTQGAGSLAFTITPGTTPGITDVYTIPAAGNGTANANTTVVLSFTDPVTMITTVVDAFSVGGNPGVTLTEGIASGLTQDQIVDLPSVQTVINSNGDFFTDIPVSPGSVTCFTPQSLIQTAKGLVPISDLAVGDKIMTRDHGLQELRWIGRRVVRPSELQKNQKLYPVRISAGALGSGCPERDILVSRQHRILVPDTHSAHVHDVFISAIQLTKLSGIYVDESLDFIEYIHLLFDQHEVVFVDGTKAESLFAGPHALAALTDEQRQEIRTLFPEIDAPGFIPNSAAPILTGKQQKLVVSSMQALSQ